MTKEKPSIEIRCDFSPVLRRLTIFVGGHRYGMAGLTRRESMP